MLLRPLQAEEYGQPQEAATWDFLSLIYVYQPATEGSLAEVLHARKLFSPILYLKEWCLPHVVLPAHRLPPAAKLALFVSWPALWWLWEVLIRTTPRMINVVMRWVCSGNGTVDAEACKGADNAFNPRGQGGRPLLA